MNTIINCYLRFWKISIWALVVFAVLVISACNGQNIQVVMVDPSVEMEYGMFLDIRNCQDDTDLNLTLADELSIEKQLIVANQAKSLATGEFIPISSPEKEMIEDYIEQTYQEIFNDAQETIEQTELTIPVGKIHMYNMNWKIQTYRSTVSFKIDNSTYQAEYEYILKIPEVSGMMEVSCTG